MNGLPRRVRRDAIAPSRRILGRGAAGVVLSVGMFGPLRAQMPAMDLAGSYSLTLLQDDRCTGQLEISLVRSGDRLEGRIGTGPSAITLETVVVRQRSVILEQALLEGTFLAGIEFATDGSLSGTWSLDGRSGTVVGNRRAVLGATLPNPAARHTNVDRYAVRIVTEDVDRFWHAMDASMPGELMEALEQHYLIPGTAALRSFIPDRIISGLCLAKEVSARRDDYEAARSMAGVVRHLEPAIRDIVLRTQSLVRTASLPDIYFVIGRFNTGGTVVPEGVVVAIEMYSDPNRILAVVGHEMAHFQQARLEPAERTLLSQSIFEGSADFVGELITGINVNASLHATAQGDREAELWRSFRSVMHGRSLEGWLYGQPTEGEPRDLGYFFGYRIAQAYYEKAADKRQAILDILNVRDAVAFLAASAYDPTR